MRTLSFHRRQNGDSDGEFGIDGYGLKWDEVAVVNGYWEDFAESFERGAFSHTLEDVRLLANHGGLPMARSPDTMTVSEDDVGLSVRAGLDMENPRSAEVASAIRRGDLDKMSIAFTLGEDGYRVTELPNGMTHYIISRVDRLWEVSVVPWPVHESSEVGPRGERDDRPVEDDGLARRIRVLSLY